MIWYLVCINTLAFFIYGLDKYFAKKRLYRVSEYNLFVLSIFGGSIGAILGMKIFNHKIKKISFWIFNIVLLIMWGALILSIYKNK